MLSFFITRVQLFPRLISSLGKSSTVRFHLRTKLSCGAIFPVDAAKPKYD